MRVGSVRRRPKPKDLGLQFAADRVIVRCTGEGTPQEHIPYRHIALFALGLRQCDAGLSEFLVVLAQRFL